MPINRNALIRYKTIDQCLQNRMRQWTLDDLVETCSEALYEYEGIDKGVSKRTVQGDIQMMRSEKLGYNAPIIVIDKKYYTYEDPKYSITNIPLTTRDLNKLNEVVEILKQFKGFSHFKELTGMVQKLEDKIHRSKSLEQPIIDFEKNEDLKGLEYIETIYEAVLAKKSLEITYQSFKAKEPDTFVFYAYLLKEYRNRWFVIGVRAGREMVITLALDRILHIEKSLDPYLENHTIDTQNYFQDVVGVTVNIGLAPEVVILFVDNSNAPYVLTKPIHHSQKVIHKDQSGVYISIKVQLNFELEREIIGSADSVEVISPEKLRKKIKRRLRNALNVYDDIQPLPHIQGAIQDFKFRGTCTIPNIYPRFHIFKIKNLIDQFLAKEPNLPPYGIRRLLWQVPELISLIFHENLIQVIREVDPDAFLVKSIFFDKSPEVNWYVPWHQDTPINVRAKIDTPGYYGWTQKEDVISVCPPLEIHQASFTIRIHLDTTGSEQGALKVIPNSHDQIHTHAEIQKLSTSNTQEVCEVEEGGLHLMSPLTLHASSKSTSTLRRRVIHLEFNHLDLHENLEWAEKFNF